ncbi:hypothetical protein FHS43_004550 [Streptosporangium becharense]|uniref:Uncharacterized protein n=1 Tax=Streptosporangium becharense TaxID=1816182 RepID=A0A7W9MIQ2_9ACTN|nr:hypothetical protein [Streptosporangium becharense]MBB2913252.1 hypothetical protein [Streptosporangium becharense]MBB5822235.1 hypothetical protein [Streptosporangium becharense]
MSRDGALGLHWRDADRLVFHAVPPKAESPRLVMLDVRRPGTDLLAVETLHTMETFGDGTALTLPGRTRMVVSQVGTSRDRDQGIVVVEPPAKRPTGSVFASGCGGIAAFTLDPSGRYLLVGVDNQAGMLVGDPPEPACGDAPPYELFRVDLQGRSGSTVSNTYRHGDVPSLDLPRVRVWQGERALYDIAW